MYEYKFVEIPIKRLFTNKKTIKHTTEKIRNTISENAKDGWRFVQTITIVGEGFLVPDHYEIIFEKELENN